MNYQADTASTVSAFFCDLITILLCKIFHLDIDTSYN